MRTITQAIKVYSAVTALFIVSQTVLAQTCDIWISLSSETWVRSLGQEDPLEKAMAPHYSTHAWKIPWMEDLVGYSPWGRWESDTTERPHLPLSSLPWWPGLPWWLRG